MDDMKTVATAYRWARIEHKWHHTAIEAAIAAYRIRHPEVSERQAMHATVDLIAKAAVTYGHWIYGREDGEDSDETP